MDKDESKTTEDYMARIESNERKARFWMREANGLSRAMNVDFGTPLNLPFPDAGFPEDEDDSGPMPKTVGDTL